MSKSNLFNMSHKIKIIIGCFSIIAIITTGLFFLNKELPGCFTPNFFSKIKTDVGCFVLLAVPASNTNSNGISKLEIENAAKIYFKKISNTLNDPELKLTYGLDANNNYIYIYIYTISPRLNKVNPNLKYENPNYLFRGEFTKNILQENSIFEFNGFRSELEGRATFESEFQNVFEKYTKNS